MPCVGTTGRRWIVDGIDGTRIFAAGPTEWGSLIALQDDGEIVLGVTSSPAQDRRWWATRGQGAFTGRSRTVPPTPEIQCRRSRSGDRPVSSRCPPIAPAAHRQQIVDELAGGPPAHRPWSHAYRIAEGQADVGVWFRGDIGITPRPRFSSRKPADDSATHGASSIAATRSTSSTDP